MVVYGREYWSRVINFDAMVEMGVISPQDPNLFKIVDSPEEAFEYLKEELTRYHLYPPGKVARVPEIAKTRP